MVPFLKYSVLRLALFVGVLALFAAFRAGPLLAIVGAAVVSMMLSYLFLRGTRDQVTAEIAERVERRSDRRAQRGQFPDEAHEDAAVDAAADDGPAAGRS